MRGSSQGADIISKDLVGLASREASWPEKCCLKGPGIGDPMEESLGGLHGETLHQGDPMKGLMG